MHRIRQVGKKFLTFVALLSMATQSMSPYLYVLPRVAHAQEAQEATPTDVPSDIPTVTPDSTQEVTPTPVPSDSVTPTDAPTPTDVPQDVTPVPTEEPTPESDVQVNNNSPPSDNNSSNQSSPTITPTVTQAPEQKEIGDLSIAILDNTAAPSIDLSAYESAGSASLTTDKPDYAPTDAALITGSGFNAGETYILVITSEDQPPVHAESQVTSDSNGNFVYAYQLDGNYRPNYKVELKDSTGTIIASTTFTDSPAAGCYNDSAGANDEPGQKDLTKACVDYAGLPTNIAVSWNWDEINGSGNNTYDACSLFDTDNDGFANYSACATLKGIPLAQNVNSPRIYSCSDTKADRCAGATLVSGPYTTSCSVNQQNTDPFPAGAVYPQDTVASCAPTMGEVGGASSRLLDVCSFPSQEPNSDPSDCIFASTASQTGLLEVKKVLSPTSDTGLFNLQIDATSFAVDVGNGGTTGEKIVVTGNHTVGEIAGTGTSLANYTSAIVCKDNNGAGSTIASASNAGPLTVNVANNADVVCTITNTRINNGSITIVKDAQPNDAQDFAFTTTGSGLSSFSLDDDSDPTLSNTKVFSSLAAGTYSVSEGAVTGWTQSSATCTDGSPVSAVSLQAGENVTCTFINTQDTGTITINKTLNPSNDPGKFNLQVDGSTVGTGANVGNGGTTGAITVLTTGIHTASETQGTSTLLSDYTTTYLCNNNLSGSGASIPAFSITKNQNVVCTFTNTRNTGAVKVNKLLDNDGNGTFESTNPITFTWSLDGSGTNAMGSTFNNVTTGSHGVNENSVAGYKFVGWYLGHSTDNQFSCTRLPEYSTTTLPSNVNVIKGNTTQVNLCNQLQLPILTISKSNNAPGSVQPGGTVGYTVTLTATQSSALSTKVTDLLPDGFKYNSGSWSAISNIHGALSIPEPVYNSPGVWNVGSMDAGETITLSYTATINGSQQNGIYHDIAWAQGNSIASDTVLASAVNPGFVDDNFVGTQVLVDKTSNAGVSISVKRGEVLGASTALPSTGENTLWTALAGIGLMLGLNILIAGIIIRKRYV